MSNGQEEIARLEAATGAFEQIITTEADSVEVPNVGPTPSLKKRVDDRFNEQYSGPVTYMQSANSDVDEYGYPLRTLYKNGDGMIIYHPEYSVFRKDGGSWKRIDPHVRNVVNFNGTTQHTEAPPINEISVDNGFNFEIEWYSDTGSATPSTYILHQGTDFDKSDLRVYYRFFENTYYLNFSYLGQGVTFNVDMRGAGLWAVKLVENGATYKAELYKDGEIVDSKTLSSTQKTTYASTRLLIAAREDGAGGLSQRFVGKLRDIRIWTGGDRNTGVLTDYPLDEGWRSANNQVLVNYATELGDELAVNSTFDTDLSGWNFDLEYWTWTPDGARLQGDGALKSMQQKLPSGINTLTQVEVLNVEGSLSTVNNNHLEISGIYTLANDLTESGYSGVKRRTSTTGAYDCYVKYYSVRRADGYGKYEGLTEASWTEETV